MNADLDISFRWPAMDERFGIIALTTSACFSLFLQVLDRQPPLSGERDHVALAHRMKAQLPHNLGLSWSELMVELGCTSTDPDAPLCDALAEEDRRSKDKALAGYQEEGRHRLASLALATSSAHGIKHALDSLFSGLKSVDCSTSGASMKSACRPELLHRKRASESCTLAPWLCPHPDPVHVACARQVAPKTRVTGAISVRIVVAPGEPVIVTVTASTISNRAVERCIVAKLGRQPWLAGDRRLGFDFAER